ncbi:MAG: M48 family metallopeptidase [Flavobacteriales bacterium]
MKRNLVLFVLSVLAISVCAQDVYKPIESRGEMPEDFVLKSSEKYSEAVEDLGQYGSRETQNRKEFLLQSNYSIDAMLRGGQILYNDSISNYVKKVADIIYQYNPDLPEELRFYVMRSSATNAFSTNQGIVFITTGLISQLENEAQMAFILCHEISHYVKEHTIQSFLEKKASSRRVNSRSSYDAYVALMSKYSKSQEFEADSEGLDYFIKTPYDHNEAYTAFDVLHYSYLPFDEIPFDPDFFASDYFLIHDDLKLDSINPIDVFNEDYDDSESSHPNVWKRKEKMDSLLEEDDQKTGNWFLAGENEFLSVRDLCRREGIRIYLLQGQYHKAIYSSYLLMNSEFNDEFAEISVAKALYGLHQHDAFGELREVLPRTKYIEGESTRLVHLLNELEEEELAVLAIQKLFGITQKYTENTYYKSLLEDAVYDLVFEQDLLIDDFKTSLPEQKVEQELIADSSAADSLSVSEEKEKVERRRSGKYGKIEQAKTEVITTDEGEVEIEPREAVSFFKYGLVEVLKNEEFKTYFQEISDDYEAIEDEQDSMTSREKWNKKRAESTALEKRNNQIIRNGTSLGIEEAIIFDPEVYLYDVKGDKDYLASENKKVGFADLLLDYANEKGVNYEILCFETADDPNTEFYNNMSLLSAWSFEANNLEDAEVDMIPLEGEHISGVIENTEKRYLVVTSLLYFPEKREVESSTWLLSALIWPTFPFTVAAASTRIKNNIHYLKVLDLETGRLIHRSYRDLEVRMNKKVLKAVAYDTIEQLTREKK